MPVSRVLTRFITNKYKLFSTLADPIKTGETSEKAKETILQRWRQYWKNLYLDYRDVAIDVGKECRTRPIKATIYLSGLMSCYYLTKTNPDLCSFREELLKNSMKLMHVGEPIRNPVSLNHILHIEECFNNKVIRRLNLGVASLIWLDNYSDQCNLYKVQCSYLKPQLGNFHERIVDIGFLNKWWILEEKMKDYDVNQYEVN